MPPPPTVGSKGMFSGRTSGHPLTPVSCDVTSLYVEEGFQWNLPQIFIMWVGIAEKVFKVRGQRLGWYAWVLNRQRHSVYCSCEMLLEARCWAQTFHGNRKCMWMLYELWTLVTNCVFRCTCSDEFRGVNCSEPNFCSLYLCPPHSRCGNLEDGFECEYSWWKALLFTVRLCEAYTHGIAVGILSVRVSVRLSNACIVTKRKHLAKKSWIMTNRKSPTSFPMSLRWTSYVAPNPQRGPQKRKFDQ